MMAIPFLYNLMYHHPTAQSLLHQTPEELKPGTLVLDGTRSLQKDPFDATARNLKDTKASESSLWELQSLMHHFAPTVAAQAKIFKGKIGKRPFDLKESFSSTTFDEVHQLNVSKR